MTTEHTEPGHGDSPAAWTAVTIMLVAITLGTLFFFLDMPVLVWICAAFVPIGLIAGWVLAKAGYGARGNRIVPKTHD